MTKLPASLTPRTWQWNLAISLIVIGDLSAMLAAFMPMKAILVLASDSVPGFFPGFLVDAGPVVAALALIASAAAFAGVAWGSTKSVTELDEGTGRNSGQESSLVSWKREELLQATNDRKFTASIALTLPIAIVLALVSVTYLLLTIIWIGASALWIVVRVRRSSRKALYQSGVDQFSHQLADWLRASALWSVVVLALVTLLLAPPALGSTAILIAAIFGRRLSLAIADVIPEAITRGISHASRRAPHKTTNFIKHQPKGTLVKKPIEFLSSAVGRQQLDRELRRLGLELNEFRILTPNAPSLSLVSQCPNGDQVLIRLFSLDAERERDQEFRLRQSQYGNLFPASESLQLEEITGFPGILVGSAHPGTQIDMDATVKGHRIVRFQLRREIESTLKLEQGWSSSADRVSDLLDGLLRIARIPGPHVGQCLDLAEDVPIISDYIGSLPNALVPSIPLNASHFYVSVDGDTCYLGGAMWTHGYMGDQWRRLDLFECQLRRLVAEGDCSSVVDLNAVLLNAEVSELARFIRGFNLDALNQALEKVQSRLNIMSHRG